MPLNLYSDNDSDFTKNVFWGSTSGYFYYYEKDEEGKNKRKFIKKEFKACFDFHNIETGYARYNGTFSEFIADPSLEKPAPKPDSGGDKDEWSRGFRINLLSKTLDGKMNFLNHGWHCGQAMNGFYAEFEKDKKEGQSPVVLIGEDAKQSGSYFIPDWKIVDWVDTPKEFLKEPKKAKEPEQAQPATDDDDDF